MVQDGANLANEETHSRWCPLFGAVPQSLFVLKEQVQRLSPATLAYLGDAVYELYIRSHYLMPPKRIQDYHSQVVAQVRAEKQAEQLRSLEPQLMPAELEILRRGRNAATKRTRRVDAEIYQQATSLETLVGYLYLTDPQRLLELLKKLELQIEP